MPTPHVSAGPLPEDDENIIGMLVVDEIVQVADGCLPTIKCQVLASGGVWGDHLEKSQGYPGRLNGVMT